MRALKTARFHQMHPSPSGHVFRAREEGSCDQEARPDEMLRGGRNVKAAVAVRGSVGDRIAVDRHADADGRVTVCLPENHLCSRCSRQFGPDEVLYMAAARPVRFPKRLVATVPVCEPCLSPGACLRLRLRSTKCRMRARDDRRLAQARATRDRERACAWCSRPFLPVRSTHATCRHQRLRGTIGGWHRSIFRQALTAR